MKTTILHYRKYMFIYGILSVLFVLEHFEKEENYEECEKIMKSIKEQEKILNLPLFSVVTDETINEVVESYRRFNLKPEQIIEKSKYYSELILKEIGSL